MKVAVSSTGTDLNAAIDQRFGRCAYFLIVNTDDLSCQSFANEGMDLSGGAGVQAASFVASQGVAAVLTGRCGPKAAQGLTAAGVRIYEGLLGVVKDAVEQFTNGSLKETNPTPVDAKAGGDGWKRGM